MNRIQSGIWIVCAIFSCHSGYVWAQSPSVDANGLRILEELRCGTFSTIKITNGREVNLGSRPWMALLLLRHGNVEGFACAGTLITDRFVLTAAHCMREYELVSVRLGEHQLSTETDCRRAGRANRCAPPVEDIDVEGVFKHEDYVQESSQNDIALVKLKTPVEFKQHIKPICLPLTAELQQEAESSENFVITGWGTTQNGTESDVLLEAAIEAKSRRTCRQTFRRDIKQTQLCAGALTSDSCRGDSGGPMSYPAVYNQLQRFVQFGIVSYGARDCGVGHPAVYTNVANFVPWITTVIGTSS